MNRLAAALQSFFVTYYRELLDRDPSRSIRLVLVGPPADTLRDLFNALTNNATGDWALTVDNQTMPVATLLIDYDAIAPVRPATILSAVSKWDYAVTVRSSTRLILFLVATAAADKMPESLGNTTEVLGVGRFNCYNDILWNHLVAQAATASATTPEAIREAITYLASASRDLEPTVRNELLWRVTNLLLDGVVAGLTPADTLALHTGLPSRGNPPVPLAEATAILHRLANYLGDDGIAAGITKLKSAPAAATLGPDLDALATHLQTRTLSSATFERTPALYYRPDTPIPSWWTALSVPVIDQLLQQIGIKSSGALRIECTNALNATTRVSGEPWVVLSGVALRTLLPPTTPTPATSYERKVGRSPAAVIPALGGDPLTCFDFAPPVHDAPIKYSVHATGMDAGTTDVIVLDTFGCHGVAHVPTADKNPAPKKSGTSWSQTLELPRSGIIDLTIFYPETTTTLVIKLFRADDPVGPPQAITVTPNTSQTTTVLDIEDNDRAHIQLTAADGTPIGGWTVQFAVEEAGGAARSRFEALILAHQTRRKTPVVRIPDTLLFRLEQEYVQSADSWRPMLAGWSGPIGSIALGTWMDPRLGDVFPPTDPRPVLAPPATLLDARDAVRQYLLSKARPIAEIDHADPVLRQCAETYLDEYTRWQRTDKNATWFDCIAIHGALWNLQAGQHTATHEPILILLSPLHPLRLGWHCAGQYMLSDAIKRPCPAAGLLDPGICPDSGGWTLGASQHDALVRAFFSLPTDNPHWSILLNRLYLSRDTERTAVLERVLDLGIVASGIPSGFTDAQAADSTEEVAKLLPGRATLRLGIVGGKDGSPACAEGVMQWCTDQFGEGNLPRPFAVEIYQNAPTPYPTEEALDALSEQTDEQVRWYRNFTGPGSNALDLVILDQLGVTSLGGAQGPQRTPLGVGALTSVRIREDRRAGNVLCESRISTKGNRTSGLSGLLEEACITFETTTTEDDNTAQFQFQPNQEAMGSRLQQSIYLAVTSSQIDPAWIIRGARVQDGYVWDYELPGTLGVNEASGYYLVAAPRPAMRRAIERAALLVSSTPPPVDVLLDEISRRGIPILRRLAAGGSQSRGELGLLLAVRLLQDAFRPPPRTVRLPVINEQCVHLILPVDPYEEPFEHVRQALGNPALTAQRPDLLVFALDVSPSVQIKITPVEIKFRQGQMSNTELRDALQQAANLGSLLDMLWAQPAPNDLWSTCGAGLLARCVDLAFRIYADENVHGRTATQWINIEQTVLAAILDGTAAITVSTAGRLIVFENAPTSQMLDMDGDGRTDTAVLAMTDAAVVLCGTGGLTASAEQSVGALDFSLPQCAGTAQETATPPFSVGQPEPQLAQLFSPVQDAAQEPPPTREPDQPPSPQGSEEITDTVPQPPITPAVRGQVTRAFEGFVGNEAAVRRLRNDLLRALIDNPPHLSKNLLFTGQPSTGKTELARRIASALDLPFVKLDGSGLRSREKLFDLIKGELANRSLTTSQVGQQAGLPVLYYPPLIIFIDEVHLVPRAVQESLLTMLEALDRTVTLSGEIALMNRTTFMFATTRASDLDPAFRSRCTEVQLREYTVDEVADILRRRSPHDWSASVYRRAAVLGRQVPRVALELIKELETAIAVSDHPERAVAEHLEDVRKARELDENGLTLTDLEYLNLLESADRPVGEKAIVNMLGTVDRDRIADEIEPFLRRLGFLRFGPQGRELTAQGREYVLAKRRQQR